MAPNVRNMPYNFTKIVLISSLKHRMYYHFFDTILILAFFFTYGK
jgi:hypothetical protein